MRSISANQQTNSNQITKGKKVMQFATIISTYQNNKNKQSGERRIMQSNKSCNNYKSNLNNNDIGVVDGKKCVIDKLNKGCLKSQEKMKRHNRSKTQNLDLYTHEASTLDLFTDMQSIGKFHSKKADIKREDSKKRMKTQSLKRLNPAPSNKGSSKDIKKSFNPHIEHKLSDPSSRQKKQKATKKQNIKSANQQKQRLFQTTKYDLQALRGKFKKEKSDFEMENRQKIYTMKNQKKDNKSKAENKNFSLLNLSQILHKNEYEDFLYPEQKQVRRKDMKSERSEKSKAMKYVHKSKIEAYRNLTLLVGHLTSTVNDEIDENHFNKKQNKKEQKQYQIGGRSFSFMNQAINQQMKHGRSNFSTGVDSIAIDEQIQQLIKLKLKAQQQINQKISKQINHIKLAYLAEDSDGNESKMRGKNNNGQEIGDKSARTFRERDDSEETKNDKLQKVMLLEIVEKYSSMTEKMLPFVFEPQQSINPEQYPLQDVPQRSNFQHMESSKKYNQKYIQKYNQLVNKNILYQGIINSLIRDGVDMEKYMASFLKRK